MQSFCRHILILKALGKFTAYKIPLKSLPNGVHEFDFKLDKTFFENMENADIHGADLTVHLTVDAKPEVYQMAFTVTGDLTLICDRCLDQLIVPIETSYALNVKYGDDYDDSVDDLLVIPQSDNYLNVAYMIYDTVALAIPIRHVHPLGKCNRQMSALLRKHRAQTSADVDEDSIEQQLIDEMDTMDQSPASPTESTATPVDPRWEGLAKLNDKSESN